MLTRKQLQHMQTLRGLPIEEILQRTGIPNQSLMALISGSDKDAKDPSKLMSQVTLERVLALLGVDRHLSGLRASMVNEWRVTDKTAKGFPTWKESFIAVRKELMSGNIHLAEIKKKTGLFGSREKLLLVFDEGTDVRIVITGANRKMISFLEIAFDTTAQRTEVQSPTDFELTKKLIQNGVYRSSQFNIIMGGKSARYNWSDVQSAAKEFNFHTDDLINMMVDRVKQEDVLVQPQADIVPFQRSAQG